MQIAQILTENFIFRKKNMDPSVGSDTNPSVQWIIYVFTNFHGIEQK